MRYTVRMAVRRHVVVSGRVQGVFFRDTARRRAQGMGVAGWIANRPDGTVEAVFEGPADRVESMVRYCREGPRGAHVDHVDVREEPAEGLTGFSVR
jgi:acylphosphatase